MYCIKCGVKLDDTEKQCPLCATRVFHPDFTEQDGEGLYPQRKMPAIKINSLLPQIIISLVFLLPILTVLLCDLQINDAITWAGYAIGALLLGYVIFILPTWFVKPNPVVFTPCAFASIGVYLLYINWATDGDWFLSFAFPVTGAVALIVTAVVTLLKYLRRGALYVFGGASIAFGAFMLLIEFLLNITFESVRFLGWSFYPMIVLVLLGGVLIFLAISRPARETMERTFFI